MEFDIPTWFEDDCCELMRDRGVALCIAEAEAALRFVRLDNGLGLHPAKKAELHKRATEEMLRSHAESEWRDAIRILQA